MHGSQLGMVVTYGYLGSCLHSDALTFGRVQTRRQGLFRCPLGVIPQNAPLWLPSLHGKKSVAHW